MDDQGELPNHPVQHIGDADVDVHAGHRGHHLLDAARSLMLLGAVAAVSAMGDPDADAARVFLVLGFVACLLGVCLLSLVPVAGRFPQADALAGAVIAIVSAVLGNLFTPWN